MMAWRDLKNQFMPGTTGLTKPEMVGLKAIRSAHLMGHSLSSRDLMNLCDYRSPRSASIMIEKLADSGYIAKSGAEITPINKAITNGYHIVTVDVPVLDHHDHPASFSRFLSVADNALDLTKRHFLFPIAGAWLLAEVNAKPQKDDLTICRINGRYQAVVWAPAQNAVVLKSDAKPVIVPPDHQSIGIVRQTILDGSVVPV